MEFRKIDDNHDPICKPARDKGIKNRLLGSVGEVEGGII